MYLLFLIIPTFSPRRRIFLRLCWQCRLLPSHRHSQPRGKHHFPPCFTTFHSPCALHPCMYTFAWWMAVARIPHSVLQHTLLNLCHHSILCLPFSPHHYTTPPLHHTYFYSHTGARPPDARAERGVSGRGRERLLPGPLQQPQRQQGAHLVCAVCIMCGI